MKEIILVIGGCRSGKSSYALKMANKFSKNKKLFIATSVPYDDEMRKRVTKHKKERGVDFITIETPIKIYDTIREKNSTMDVIVIDCLTLWLSNLMENRLNDNDIFNEVKKLKLSCNQSASSVIMVANEVGSGIVPENSVARRFRDIAGFINQEIASHADRVFWTVAGIPTQIK